MSSGLYLIATIIIIFLANPPAGLAVLAFFALVFGVPIYLSHRVEQRHKREDNLR